MQTSSQRAGGVPCWGRHAGTCKENVPTFTLGGAAAAATVLRSQHQRLSPPALPLLSPRTRANKNSCGALPPPKDDSIGSLIGDLQENLVPNPAP